MGLTSAPISCRGSKSRNWSRRRRAATRMWWSHFGQTSRLRSSSSRYSTALHASHLVQSPSGIPRPFALLRPLRPDPRRTQLLKPAHRSADPLLGAGHRVHGASQLGDESADPIGDPFGLVQRLLHSPDDRGPHHDRVRDRSDPTGRVRVRDPETDADGQGGDLPYPGQRLRDRGGIEVGRPRDALEGDVVEKPGRLRRDAAHPRDRGRGREQEDGVDAVLAKRSEQRLPLLGRHVDDDDAVDSRCGRRFGEPGVTHRDDRVEIAHEDQTRLAVVRTELAREVEHAGEGHAGRESALPGPLDHRAVRHRIGERDAELDDVRTSLHEAREEAAGHLGGGVSGRDEGYEGGAARGPQLREPAGKTAHPGRSSMPWSAATVGMSLSPRPDRLTMTIPVRGRARASFCACASA